MLQLCSFSQDFLGSSGDRILILGLFTKQGDVFLKPHRHLSILDFGMHFSVLQFFFWNSQWDTTVHFCLSWHPRLWVQSFSLPHVCFLWHRSFSLSCEQVCPETDQWPWWYYYFSTLRLFLPSVSSLRLTLTLPSGTALSMVTNSHHQVKWLFLSSHSHWSFLILMLSFGNPSFSGLGASALCFFSLY